LTITCGCEKYALKKKKKKKEEEEKKKKKGRRRERRSRRKKKKKCTATRITCVSVSSAPSQCCQNNFGEYHHLYRR
jgi:hypothetical protein